MGMDLSKPSLSRSCLVPGFSLLLAACGGGGGGGATGGPASSVVVIVSPSYARLAPGEHQLFTAQVTGSPAGVLWSVPGGNANGTVTGGGDYQAPDPATGIFTVRASLEGEPGSYGEAVVDVSTAPPTGACNSAELGAGADLRGYVPFPADNPWNQDISGLPVAANSASIIAFIGASAGLKGDFGTVWEGSPIGIPYIVVAGAQAPVPIDYTDYGDESDPQPMPIPANAPIEGGAASDGDRHVLVLDRDNCLLYELGRAFRVGAGWEASGGAIWDLRSNALRPWSWTSADAAGLPIFPGLVRYDEVASGAIHHALRFTVPVTRRAYIAPATHWASSNTNASAPPMGLRVRLKAGKDLGGFPPRMRVILEALKRYGMILADNGSTWYVSGTHDLRWDDDEIHALGAIKGSDLEVVDTGPVHTSHPTGSAPAIASLTATPASIAAGGSVDLAWSASDATRFFVTPSPGLVRGTSITVQPSATTTYTLTAQGPYGSATRTVTVTVH